MKSISNHIKESEKRLFESFLEYLSDGIIPKYMTHLSRSSYEDPNLMKSISSKKQSLKDENSLKNENKLRFSDFLRSVWQGGERGVI